MRSVTVVGPVPRCHYSSNSAPAVHAVTQDARGALCIKSGNPDDIRCLTGERRKEKDQEKRYIGTQSIHWDKGRLLRVFGRLQGWVFNNFGEEKSTGYENRRCGTLRLTIHVLYDFPLSLYMCSAAQSRPSKGRKVCRSLHG